MTNENQPLINLVAACEELKDEIMPKLKDEVATDAEFKFVFALIKYKEWLGDFIENNE